MNFSIAILIPCYNESLTITKVISDFKRELPNARIVVLNNRSTDNSAQLAQEAGAEVIFVATQGKGAVVRDAFRSINADAYVMVDGDDTYPAEAVHELLEALREENADMVIGDRLSNGTYAQENKRGFHDFGNNLVRWLVNHCFKSNLHDIMTGYRIFSRRFVKNIPILSNGFEVETEITIAALDRRLRIVEVPIIYRDRPNGSFSKLNTFKDGFRVLKTIGKILRNYRPLFFFGSISLCCFFCGLGAGIPVLLEFARTRYITHVPLALLAVGFMILFGLMLSCAMILNTLVAYERQSNELHIANFEK